MVPILKLRILCAVAMVTFVVPFLSLASLEISDSGNGTVALSWTNSAVLQHVDELGSIWRDIREATSPFTNEASRASGFYRLRLPDYTLFANLDAYTDVALMDYDGQVVHVWSNDFPAGASVYLLADGSIFRSARISNTNFSAGGSGGRMEKRAWDGTLSWSFDYSSSAHCQHHDTALLPNGNVLAVAWESLTRDEALALGRDPALMGDVDIVLWPDTIVEIEPGGTNSGSIVWKWSVMDHLIQDYDPSKPNYGVVEDHPELVDFNYPRNTVVDWMHVNAVTYNEELDQIMISVRTFSEIWIIDHGTTPEEATSHSGGRCGKGGDLLYRWGNPFAYGMGTQSNQVFGGQHDPTWIPANCPGAGHILVFNNGIHRGYSSADELIPPLLPDGTYERSPDHPYGPTNLVWTYDGSVSNRFSSPLVSSAQRLPDGNTLIDLGTSRYFFEVSPDGELQWEYHVPGAGLIFRGTRVLFDLP